MPYPIVGGLRSIELGFAGRLRSELTALVLVRKKRATASLLSEYEDEGEAVEHVGERLAVLDDDAGTWPQSRSLASRRSASTGFPTVSRLPRLSGLRSARRVDSA